jgi:selenide,water dikinase
VTELIAEGMLPAGCYRNRDHYQPLIAPNHPDSDALLPLFDPQTSGGMLIALPPKDADRFMTCADRQGIFARRIGCVLPPQTYSIEVL